MGLRLEGPHIQASGYRRGRDRKRWPENGITFLVLHTAEGATDEIELGHFFATLGTASSNCGIGQDGGYASYVRYRDTPWTNPPIHDDTETLEICGFAGWSRRTWLRHDKMLETIARWIAWRSAVNDIPIRRIEGDRLRNGVKGIVDHDGINDVFHDSDHWDIGENFPWDIVLPRAREIRKNQGAEEDDMAGEGPQILKLLQRHHDEFNEMRKNQFKRDMDDLERDRHMLTLLDGNATAEQVRAAREGLATRIKNTETRLRTQMEEAEKEPTS